MTRGTPPTGRALTAHAGFDAAYVLRPGEGSAGRGRQRRPGGAPGFSQTLRPARPPVSPRLTTEALRTEGWPGSCGQQTNRLRHPQLGTRAPAAVSSSCGRVRLRHHPPRAPLGPRHCAAGGPARGGFGCDGPGGAGVQPNIQARASPAAPPTAAPRSWPCEDGAGPGGGRRRLPRPAPLARRAPAPAFPPVSDDLTLALLPPRRCGPRRLP